jgi:hypothetical protein
MGNKYTLTNLRELGWTQSLIEKFLPEPELMENPYYPNSAPMKLWKKKMVNEIMDTDEFQKAQEEVEEYIYPKIKIELIEDDEELRSRVLRSIPRRVVNFECRIGDERGRIDEEVMRDWALRYIKNHLVDYDFLYEALGRQVNKKVLQYEYGAFIMQKIFEVYPKYSKSYKTW